MKQFVRETKIRADLSGQDTELRSEAKKLVFFCIETLLPSDNKLKRHCTCSFCYQQNRHKASHPFSSVV